MANKGYRKNKSVCCKNKALDSRTNWSGVVLDLFDSGTAFYEIFFGITVLVLNHFLHLMNFMLYPKK